ncbi:SOS response-associated peptidase [Thalassotalea sp. M1531]|uniref:Abasic site processing protein n=1 Tax=Thalassotalea algicola TaxID=2716224 RepID=A0A7Y0LED5_9GAMM|nr:SOS response-associated peptidase [Thalassotalea algicola]NMP32707.1 SOS response-associated peptidase [Thalassotalea algicola]
MCGRLNVIDDTLCLIVSEMLGIDFHTQTNTNLCPSENVATIIRPDKYTQLDASWGIQPSWSKQLLINAKSETVAEKPTFKSAFIGSRCLIPCTGWYEWKKQGRSKVKYSFTHKEHQPFFMAGVLFNPTSPQVITLTTTPNKDCAEIHNRMPVLIKPSEIAFWFNASPEQLSPLMMATENSNIAIEKVTQ